MGREMGRRFKREETRLIHADIWLLLGRKAMTNLDSILKSRDITLLIKVRLVKAMVFPVVMYGCESWPIKKAEHQRINAFELWCWRRLLRVPWTARRSNQSILKEIVTRVYVPQFFVSSQQRFGATDIKALGVSQLLGLGQTVLWLLGNSVLQLYFI